MHKIVAINIDTPAGIVQIHKFYIIMVATNAHKYIKIRSFLHTVKYYMFLPTMWPSSEILNSKVRCIKESNEFIKKKVKSNAKV
jgi:hypothetical protein